MVASAEEMQAEIGRLRKEVNDFQGGLQAVNAQITLTAWSLNDRLNSEVATLRSAILQQVPVEDESRRDNDDITNRRAFANLRTYSGKSEEFEEWKFQFKVFLQKDAGLMDYLTTVELMDKTPTEEMLATAYQDMVAGFSTMVNPPKLRNAEWITRQLYQALCLKLTGTALSLVKNFLPETRTNGLVGWWKLCYEATGMTPQKMQGLAGKVYAPKRCKRYSEVTAAIEEWEIVVRHFQQAENVKLSDQTRIYSLRQLVPEELERDIIRSQTLTKPSEVKDYITQQVPTRRDMPKTSGPEPMDLGMA